MNTDKVKPTKITKEDVELADEIVRVTAIKELVSAFTLRLAEAFGNLTAIAEKANPVKTYVTAMQTQSDVMKYVQIMQAKLLEVLGQVEEEDAHELADPEAGIGTNINGAGDLDAALADVQQDRLTNAEPLDILEEN